MQNKGTYICGMEKFGLFFAEELKQRKRIVPLLLENTVGKSSADADFKKSIRPLVVYHSRKFTLNFRCNFKITRKAETITYHLYAPSAALFIFICQLIISTLIFLFKK